MLYDFSDAVLSNERSANAGNTEKDGRIVNHQWSKSLEFEKAFQQLTAPVIKDFRYFSLLRPLSELAIAKLFSRIHLVEMHHLQIFSQLARLLGQDPRLWKQEEKTVFCE